MHLTSWKSALLSLCITIATVSSLEPILFAQTGNVVISTDTTYATGTYNLTNLSVENGATLTIGGGSIVSVSGAVVVTANSNVVLQSINNAAQVNGSWQGAGVTVNAASLRVDAGSSINADGQGYLASAGPGGAAAGSSAGGSYGGTGGVGSGPTPAAAIYGSNTTPGDLGSGGGSRCCGAIAGNGGGAVRLNVSGTLTDNGVISANGGNLVGYQGGGGSGGSVWVTTAGLVGSGVFTANGGTGGEAAGGGGRTAVYYDAPSSNFTGFSTSTTNGGSCGTQCSDGTASAGGVGTSGFFDTSATNDNLMVDQNLMIPANTTVTYNSITVQPGAVLTIGGGSTVTVTHAVTISGTLVAQSIDNAVLVNGSWQGKGVALHAASVTVNKGGSINADGQGYIAGAGPGGAPNGSSAAGSYGGLGGVGNGVSPGPIYGSTTVPTDLGSGGNTRCCGTMPGAGGGLLTVIVSETLTDDGVISANGEDGRGLQVGGGSGGTVSIQTKTLTGSGSVAANGGVGGEAGGGGGRVAIYYTSNSGFNITQVTSNGGTSSNGNPGAVGTVYTLGAGSNLTVSQDTVLPPNANLSFGTVTVNNGATLTVGSQTTLASNSVRVTGGGNFTVGGGSTLNIDGGVLVTNNSQIVLQAIDTAAQVDGIWQALGVTVNAGSVQVDAGSSINADGQGYLVSAGPGGALAGSSAGGSYGGMGGSGAGPVPAAAIYGSNNTPSDLGSGGGSRCCGAIAGTGGGLVRLIVSGTLTDDGVISANGRDLVGYQGGGGSGGSVWVTTTGLAGSGVFLANGGTGGEAAGGGGRVAVYYNAPTSSFTGFSASTSNGASCGTQCSNGNSSAGGVGTVGFFDTSATNDNLMVAQDLTIPAGTTVSYNSITVQPGATLTIGGGSAVTVANSLTVGGTVIAQSINNSALLNNTWQGRGVTINAVSIVVNTGGSITADSQGYLVSAGPGGAPPGSSTGGTYGGLGGTGDGSLAPAALYGSTTAPADLGSGGGYRCCSTIAGNGGGALSFNVSGAFTNNGNVSANGGDVIGYQAGGGSGGSIYVRTAALIGSGGFTANGGVGGEAGGGGGRVAVYYDAPSSNFTGFAASAATGGACGVSSGSACSNAASGGSNGTAAFFDTSAANNNLAIYQNFTIPAGSSPTYNSMTVQNGALLTIGGGATVTVTNALTVGGTVVAQSANNTAQVNGAWAGAGVAINAGAITVNATGSLNADSQGYVANAGPGGAPADTSAGASYGGLGGAGNGSAPGPTYGSKMLPVDLGSGGGTRCCGTVPGAGGGYMLLNVSGTLTDDGVISANGGDGIGLQVGGGSGGSISIHAPSLTGSGSVAANGGAGGEAGGGGGRVALYFDSASGFDLTLATATGGSSDGSGGAVGTVYIPGVLVVKAASTSALTASPTQLSPGQSVSLQAIVTAATGGPTPTGTVNFVDGTTVIGTQALSASQPIGTATASFETTALALGTHSITALYGGDASVLASTSAAQTVTVSLIATTSTLGLSAATITVGQTETLTMAIKGGTGSPAMTGTVSFFDNTLDSGLGNAAVTSTGTGGIAMLAVSNLTVGTHVLNAHYGGDSDYQAVTAPNQTVVVTAKTQTITFATIPAHTVSDAPFGLTATVDSGLPITFTVVSGPATVSGSTVTLTGATGTVAIRADSAGDATYAAAPRVTQSFVVSPAIVPMLTTLTPPGAVVGSGAVTVTLTGANFNDGDVVMFGTSQLPTTFVNATTLMAVVPETLLGASLTAQVKVVDNSAKTQSLPLPFVVSVPAIVFSGPTTAASGEQPTLTFRLTNPYPVPLVGALTLTFAPAPGTLVDDTTVQFSNGSRSLPFTIAANSTATPTVMVQTGTVAGTVTITLNVTANGFNATPPTAAPVVIDIPVAVPVLSSTSVTGSGKTLTVVVHGFSNTRELTTAIFHFTPANGATLGDSDVTAAVAPIFVQWFRSTESDQYGSTFTYTQNFTVSDDASHIGKVTVTLVNSLGQSIPATAQ